MFLKTRGLIRPGYVNPESTDFLVVEERNHVSDNFTAFHPMST